MLVTMDSEDWTQWMRWEGSGRESITSSPEPRRPARNSGALSDLRDGQSFSPVSPVSNKSAHASLFLSTPDVVSMPNTRICGPLTPDHTSTSPEDPQLPEAHLHGDTLRSTCSSGPSLLGRKRKYLEEPEPTIETGAIQRQKRPHNIIEKRYRANLNEKISELRESVPSLCSVSKKRERGRLLDGAEDPVEPAKLNKARILSKAVEYIQHLELRNKKLDDENLSLKKRLIKLELLASNESGTAKGPKPFTCKNSIEEPTQNAGSGSDGEDIPAKHVPDGLIPLPESMKNLRQNQPQEHYGAIYDAPQQGRTGSRRWPAKFMLGSLAGLMLVDGLSEPQDGSDSQEKGLFGIPLQFLDGWWFLRSPRAFVAAFMQYCRAGGTFPLIKGFSALTLLAFIVFMYLFNSKPAEVETTEKPSCPRTVSSLASPIAVRRQAWLTSMHTLKLPHHTFFPEWFAVTMEWLKYSVRLVLGFPAYYWITGRSGEDEMARVKAWDIAIDAQLAGGDPEISRSRLVLSIFASGTLPQTPARLMLKALHCKVVLWKVGRHDGAVSRVSNIIATFLADRQWKRAQTSAATMKDDRRLDLPLHLANLLQYECQDVMLDPVLERAYALMYDRSITGDRYGASSLMDDVVEDHAVKSPLDAIAAWWSGQRLYEALIISTTDRESSLKSFESCLDAATEVAPPLSAAHIRALAIKAVFFDSNRAMNAHRVHTALPNPQSHDPAGQFPPSQSPFFIDSSIPLSAYAEVSKVATCASIMAELHDSRAIKGLNDMKRTARRLFSDLDLDSSTMSPLSFAAAFYVLLSLLGEDDDNDNDDEDDDDENNSSLSKPIHTLSEWAYAESVRSPRLSPGVVAKLDFLLNSHQSGQAGDNAKRRKSDASHDTGYGSFCEAEGS